MSIPTIKSTTRWVHQAFFSLPLASASPPSKILIKKKKNAKRKGRVGEKKKREKNLPNSPSSSAPPRRNSPRGPANRRWDLEKFGLGFGGFWLPLPDSWPDFVIFFFVLGGVVRAVFVIGDFGSVCSGGWFLGRIGGASGEWTSSSWRIT